MKSKKLNLNIVNQFIEICVEKNICAPDQILSEAQKQISEIDLEMFKILKLKNKKLELLEVVNFFSEFKENQNKFFMIKNHKVTQEICEKIKSNKDFNIKNIDPVLLNQLIEYKILSIENNKIILGNEYEKYELSAKNG